MKRELKHDYNAIYQRHLSGETLLSISKNTGIHIQSIYSHFKKNNWEYNRNIQIREDNYFVNDNYLNNIDSEDKAYFLGWMLSDGGVSHNKISLKLIKTDDYIIKEIFDKFSNGYKMTENKNNKSMSLSSKKMISELAKLGCVENKGKIGFDLPDIPNDLFRHFVRGYFDGDGSIGERSLRPNQTQINICSIDNDFLIQLQEKLNKFNISSVIYMENRKGKLVNMFRLVLPTHKERLKFFDFLYENCNIKLIRKYDKYKKYYDNIITILKKKNSKIIEHTNDKIKINYDLIDKNIFNKTDEINEELIINMFKNGKNEYSIHKETKIGRSVIKRIITQNS